jgi:hypothetical protein
MTHWRILQISNTSDRDLLRSTAKKARKLSRLFI